MFTYNCQYFVMEFLTEIKIASAVAPFLPKQPKGALEFFRASSESSSNAMIALEVASPVTVIQEISVVQDRALLSVLEKCAGNEKQKYHLAFLARIFFSIVDKQREDDMAKADVFLRVSSLLNGNTYVLTYIIKQRRDLFF